MTQYRGSRPSTAEELAERIEAEVAAGALAGGARLPSIREAASDLSLAPNTVAAAYRRLAERGIVAGRGGAGTFVLERPPLGVHRGPVIPAGAVDLASGAPDPRLLPDLGPHLVHRGPSSSYGDAPLLPALETGATAWLEWQGLAVSRLALTSGALDAIERVLTAHLRPGDAVGVEQPAWSAVTDLIGALGMQSVGIPIDERGMLPDELAARLPSVEALIVTPRAQNPCGAALDAPRRTDLVTVLDQWPDTLVIEDDHAGPIAGAPLHTVSPGRRRWAFVQSVAKALGPDLRLALVTGDDLTLDRVVGRFGLGPGWVSRILQSAVASMLSDAAVRRLLGEAEAAYTHRRVALVTALREAGVTRATGESGLNVWAPVPSEEGALAGALAAGFVVRSGAAFRAAEPAVRITVANLDLERIPLLVAAMLGQGDSGRLV